MGKLFQIIEDHIESKAPYQPSFSRVAEQIGVSRQTLLNWRSPTRLIDKKHIVAISQVTGVPFERVRDALLEDIGYWTAEDPPAAEREKGVS